MDCATGETVIHPQHGNAVVQRTFTKDVGAGPVEYLELYVPSISMTLLVPAASVEELNIRHVASPTDAEAILAVLEDDCEVPERWAERNATTITRMKSGNLVELAMVARDLTHHARRTGKPLSANEQGNLDRCLDLLSSELSLSLGISKDELLALIAEKLGSDAEPLSSTGSSGAGGTRH